MPAVAAPADTQAQSAALTDFAVEAGPLERTLDAIAAASGQQVSYDPKATAQRLSHPVKGRMTTIDAVKAALAGMPLTVKTGPDGSLRVYENSLELVVVYAKRDQAETSFKADRSSTATRSGTDLMDLPQSMTIITARVLETRQVQSVVEALSTVSGIAYTDSPQGLPSYSVRGFAAVPTTNGLADGYAATSDINNIERIEVLKGPQAVLAGSNAMGGAVNIVKKKPQAEPTATVKVEAGSRGAWGLSGDFGNAVNSDDKRLSWRLTADKSDAASSLGDYEGRRSSSVMPQLRWKDATTDVVAGLEYTDQHLPAYQYTFAIGGAIAPVPDRRLGTAQDGFDLLNKRAFVQLDQKFTDALSLHVRGQRELTDFGLHVWAPLFMPSATTVFFSPSRNSLSMGRTVGDGYLLYTQETGPVLHKLSVGLNYDDQRSSQVFYTGSSVSQVIYPSAAATSFGDVYSATTSVSSYQYGHVRQVGAYVQDLMNWGPWSLLLNFRRTSYSSESVSEIVGIGNFSTPRKTYANSPGVGVVYNLTPESSLYANWAQGYNPQFQALCGGGVPDPVKTTNKELGAKFDVLDHKLGLTTSVFELAMSNTLEMDTVQHCLYERDSRRTRGVEMDLQGRLAQGWNATANYTYSQIKDAGNVASSATSRAAGVPKNRVSFWTTYELPWEAVRGVSVGAGLNFTSRTSGTSVANATYFEVPGQTRLDANVSYRREKSEFTLGVKNLTNRRLYSVSGTTAYVPLLPDRTLQATYRQDFR